MSTQSQDSWPTFLDVSDAYRNCVVSKNAKDEQLKFEITLGQSLLSLFNDLQKGRYKPSMSTSFVVTDSKPREVFAPAFRDRVVHHLIVKQLERWWLPKFSSQSFACIKGRGQFKALDEFKRLVRKISQGGRAPVYALKMDIKSFFVTIHRPTLLNLLLASTKSEKLKWLIRINVLHDARLDYKFVSSEAIRALIPTHKSWLSQPKDFGIPIGNLTSQFYANVYLNGLDHFVVRKLKPQGYIRYMDDLLLLDRDPEILLNCVSPVELWLNNERKQNLNPEKTSLVLLRDGMEYLGYKVFQENNSREPLQIYFPAKKKWKLVREARRVQVRKMPRTKILDPIFFTKSRRKAVRFLSALNSHLGHSTHAKAFRFRRDTMRKLRRIRDVVVRDDCAAISSS